MNGDICQSCALPFDEAHAKFRANEADGRPSRYCTYCYQEGTFLHPEACVEDMIEMGVPHLGRKIGMEAARAQLSALLPTLERWRA